jgi:hypothetical protein
MKSGDFIMKVDVFFDKLSGQSVEQNVADLKEFVKKNLSTKKDTIFEEGAQYLFIGGVLFMLEQKTKPTIDGLKHLFALDEISDNKYETIVKNFKKASKQTSSYISGYLCDVRGTFYGFISTLQTYLNRF